MNVMLQNHRQIRIRYWRNTVTMQSLPWFCLILLVQPASDRDAQWSFRTAECICEWILRRKIVDNEFQVKMRHKIWP